MDFIPEKSEIQLENIKVDRDPILKSLIKDLGVRKLIPAMQQKQHKNKTQWASLSHFLPVEKLSASLGTARFVPLWRL